MSGKGKQSSKKAMVKSRESVKPQPASSLSNSNDSSNSERPEVSVALPVIKTVDNTRHLPRYSAVLQRNAEEGIVAEDLDTLQLELEILLSSVVVRSRIIQEEIANLSSAEERRDKRSERSKSGKGLSFFDKRLRDDKSKSKDSTPKSQPPLSGKLYKSKGSSSSSQVVPNPHEIVRGDGKSDVPKPVIPKNDTPNKFWASVEPYCQDIMPDDIKLLEELIANHGDLGEFKKIPPLGRHYSLIWAHNDLLQEEEAANSGKEKRKSRSDVSSLLSKGEKKTNGIAGPLTQRLVSALFEENVYVGNNNTENKVFRDGDPPVLRDLTIQNSINLELRMHKELVEQGILEADSQRKHPDDDEILAEVKRCQQELNALSSHNVQQLTRLLNLAQEESKRQALKRRISVADAEVVDHYQKFLAAKQRKVPLPREEQEKAWACLRERENLLDQLNKLPSHSVGEPVKFTTSSA